MVEEKKGVKKEISEEDTKLKLEKEIEEKKKEIEEKEGIVKEEKKEPVKEEKRTEKEIPVPEEKIEDVKAKIEEKGELKGVETKFKIKVKPEIPKLPELTDKKSLDVRYGLIEPYAYVHIHWDEKEQELIYEIEEPELDDKEKGILKTIEEGIEELINISFLGIKTPEAVIAFLEKNIKVLLNELGVKVSEESFLKLMYYVYRDFVGLNEIEPLMKDYFIEDIECNGVDTPVYVVHRRYRNLKTNIVYKNIDKLRGFVEKLAQKCGKYISYASPVLDAALPDGSRLNCVYTQEIASKGPSFTIRKFVKIPWSPIKLMELKTVSPEILAYLWLLVEQGCNIMIIGGTASGKTSFLNVVACFIPPQARVISIEDTKEIRLMHENWLPSVARTGMAGGKGEITLFDLLKASFRQRPDYVIVGEIRGKEAFVLFQGMASGHSALGTMHADDVETMIKRLETPPINLSPTLVELMDAVVIMTQAKYKRKPVRRVAKVTEIVKVLEEKKGMAKINIPFVWDPRTDKFFFKLDSYIFNKLIKKHGLVSEELLKEFKNRTRLLVELYKRRIVSFEDVQEVIYEYYRNKDEVLKKFGIE